jgi:hypothetical protein
MHYISEHLPQYIFKFLVHGEQKTEKPTNKVIQFRNSSDIQLEKKPCPCMANKIKPPESS